MSRHLSILTIQQKMSLISQFEKKKKTKKELAALYQCDISTVNRILRNQNKILEIASANKNLKAKRQRKSIYLDVEKALTKWFDQARAQNAVISGSILLKKAKELAVELKSDLQPNNGWLGRWKKRENIHVTKMRRKSNESDQTGSADNHVRDILENIHVTKMRRESNESDQTGAADKHNVTDILGPILTNYFPNDVFNAGESGLMYRALPNGTFAQQGELVKGDQLEKARINLLFLCNSTGTYKKIFAIGKSKNPRCFNKKNLPITYFSNEKACMTNAIWNTIVSKIDEEMGKEKRKIILFVNNPSCHIKTVEFKHVCIQFLPTNTTALIQPLDQGIIHSFKSNYRQIIARKQLAALEKGLNIKQFVKTISLLEAMNFVKRAWRLVTGAMIKKCFKKAGFHFPDLILKRETAEENTFTDMPPNSLKFERLTDTDNNLECLDVHPTVEIEIVDEVKKELNVAEEDDDFSEDAFPVDMPSNTLEFKRFIDTNNDLQCLDVHPTVEIEIVDEVKKELNVAEEDDHLSEDTLPVEEEQAPTLKEALCALDILRKFAIHQGVGIEDIENLEERIINLEVHNINQKKITDFFS